MEFGFKILVEAKDDKGIMFNACCRKSIWPGEDQINFKRDIGQDTKKDIQ
jgi:hypothetical protein